MKLSKMLLGAILAGVTITTVTSCTKNDDDMHILKKDVKGKGGNDVIVPGEEPYDCPGCGMG